MKIRLWAVVGPPNSGKSSVIGTLVSQTGKGPGGIRSILLRGGGWLDVHAYRQSIQESNTDIAGALDKFGRIATNSARKNECFHVNFLLALRSDTATGLPAADAYLREFEKNNWDLQSIALLDQDNDYEKYANFGAPLCNVLDSTSMMANSFHRNWVFGQVRNHFGWA